MIERRNMKTSNQKGMTTIGLIIVIAIFGSIVLTGFKILPMYMEYFQVKSIIELVAENKEVDIKSPKAMWEAISKGLRVNQIRSINREHISFDRAESQTTITIDYETRKPYIAQLFIGAHFVYSVNTNR